MNTRKTALLFVLSLAGVLSGCPEEKMTRYYIAGDAVYMGGDSLNDIIVSLDICSDGVIDAKEVTYDSDGFTFIETIWEDCDQASLLFEEIRCREDVMETSSKKITIRLDRLTDKDRRYEYYTTGVIVDLYGSDGDVYAGADDDANAGS